MYVEIFEVYIVNMDRTIANIKILISLRYNVQFQGILT